MNHSQNPLEQYFYQNRKNIIHKWPHYFEVYHRHFNRFIDTECVVMEIGVAQGGSLKMWKHYFGEIDRNYSSRSCLTVFSFRKIKWKKYLFSYQVCK